MNRTFKALSALLTYPTEELRDAAGDIGLVLAQDKHLPAHVWPQLSKLTTELATGDLYDLQERYVLLFDRTRSLSLHLFEHVHGESRDRGQAMIDLKALYEKHSLLTASSELPDFLPLFLEFLSILPVEEAREQLGQISHIASTLETRLRKRQAPYEVLFRALGDLAVAPPVAEEVRAPALEDEDPTDLAALDAQWEDAPVTFGPEAAPDCGEQLFARIRAARRPAQNLEH